MEAGGGRKLYANATKRLKFFAVKRGTAMHPGRLPLLHLSDSCSACRSD
jgi:hypothetical protein